MQIKISLESNNNIYLPVHYNHILQAFIYNNIDKKLSEFLHNEGYIEKGRSFKLFTFSRILTRGKIEGNLFRFGKKIEIIISSVLDSFCRSVVNSMLQSEELYLGRNKLRVGQLEILNNQAKEDEMVVKTYSPIVSYSTFNRPDGGRYTCYYEPYEGDFKRIVSENLVRKYNAYYNVDLSFEDGITIEPLGRTRMNIVYYKDFLIKGASGRFKIKGDKRLLQLGLDVGLGSKNSQGFGYISNI